jgi:hypothetical protein
MTNKQINKGIIMKSVEEEDPTKKKDLLGASLIINPH